MKNRIVSIIMAAVLAAAALTGCTTASVAQAPAESEKKAESSETAESSEESTDEAEAADAADDKYSDIGVDITSSDVKVVVAEQGYYIAPIIEHFGWYEKVFADHNITVETVNFDSGPEIIEAISAGSVDWGAMGTQPAVSGAANGGDISVVASFVDQSKSGVLATLSDDINSVKDLAGKKVGAKVGSSEYAFLLWALQEEGLTVDDIEVINLDIAAVATALENGEVDAAVCNINRFLRVEVDDGIKFKYIKNAVGSGTALQVIAVRNTFAEEHPDIISALLELYVWAEDYIANNHDEAVKIISDYFGVEPDIPENTLTYQTYEFAPMDEFYDTTDKYLDFMYENEYITERIPTDDFVKVQYAEAIGLK
ncbi:MAG: aliphatic sulfonate ABC transporter substrate-binding protein [Lachnospiraceae bacterium]|nr:aliphatic sulfonate ABC transporter substrate-binding protein [Lachnospiraceae bacterium]